jgi:hypothetical protein
VEIEHHSCVGDRVVRFVSCGALTEKGLAWGLEKAAFTVGRGSDGNPDRFEGVHAI